MASGRIGTIDMTVDSMETKPFSADTESDAIQVINRYTAGWPYSRPVDSDLVEHWKTLGQIYQPENMLIVYCKGKPRAFLHGGDSQDQFIIYVLAIVPGAVDEGVALLKEAEQRGCELGRPRVRATYYSAGGFYAGYICGQEPYHPHWAIEATEAYIRSGFRITHHAVILVRDMYKEITVDTIPQGYTIDEVDAKPEFGARTFRYAVIHKGDEVASCKARLYADLSSPAGGGLVGQIGHVSTRKEHRGKGLARIMTQYSLHKLKEWGASGVLVATGLENYPALRVYERVGFERRHYIVEWSKDLK